MALSNEQARRAGGSAITAERIATGQAITARRTGAADAADINAIVRVPRQRKALRTLDARGGLSSQVGTGNYEAPTQGVGGGIAGPLTEKTTVVGGATVPDREYWPGGHTSSDGLFVLPAWKTVTMLDANDAEVVFEYANPQGTVP